MASRHSLGFISRATPHTFPRHSFLSCTILFACLTPKRYFLNTPSRYHHLLPLFPFFSFLRLPFYLFKPSFRILFNQLFLFLPFYLCVLPYSLPFYLLSILSIPFSISNFILSLSYWHFLYTFTLLSFIQLFQFHLHLYINFHSALLLLSFTHSSPFHLHLYIPFHPTLFLFPFIHSSQFHLHL